MDYSAYSRDMLLERIEELEILNQELLKEKENEINLDHAWTGNLGHWYWNVKTDLLHPDDYPKAMEAMKDHLYGKASVYEVEYRIRTKTGKNQVVF